MSYSHLQVKPATKVIEYCVLIGQSNKSNSFYWLKFNTCLYNPLLEWNSLNEELKNSSTLAEFKRKLIARVRPEGNPIYDIANLQGIRLLTKCRLEFSPLNEHQFRHNFDCLNLFCNCGMAKEDNEHFFLHLPTF